MSQDHVRAGTLPVIEQVLPQGAKQSDSRRTLIIDEALIHLLSISVQGSYLKARGFEKWYRLSNYHEATKDYPTTGPPLGRWVVIMFLDASPTRRAQDAAIRCVLRLANACQKGSLHIKLCFVPRRTCAQVSYLLLSIRSGLNIPLASWSERGDALCSGRISLSVADVPITYHAIDTNVYSLTFPTPYTLAHAAGDMFGVSTLMANIKSTLAGSVITSVVSLVGVGADGQLLAKKIGAHLVETLGGTPDISHAGSTCDPLHSITCSFAEQQQSKNHTRSHGETADTIHSYVSRLLIPEGEVETSDVFPEIVREATDSDVLTDGLLSRCLVQQAETHDLDMNFVRDEIRESGLTRRAQQASFKIRIPDSSAVCPKGVSKAHSGSTLKSIIVIDRAVDWISTLLTPFTYEAMLDLQWGIYASDNLQLPSSSGRQSETVKLHGDLFFRLRDSLLSDIGPRLHEEALRIQSHAPPQSSKSSAPSGSVTDMHQTLAKMKEYERAHRELSTHIRLVSQLVQNLWKNPAFYTLLKIEDDILNNPTVSLDAHVATLCQLAWRNAPLVDVIRLMMLLVLVKGPNSASRSIDVRGVMVMIQSVLHALASVHGSSVHQVWQNLETAVFRSPISQVELPIAQASTSQTPVGFVHGGVCPLSVEILESIIKQYPHPACPPGTVWRQKIKMLDSASRDGDILLVFPHHVTYSELAALRCLATSISRNFIVQTGSVMGYKTFVLNDRSCYSDQLDKSIL